MRVMAPCCSALGMQSWVVAADLGARHSSLGTMTLATEVGRRGYRPSDQVTIDDLVARSSIAFERGLLYQEARQAADDASRRADQLARLVEATTELTRILTPSVCSTTLVEQASYVLDAPYAHAELVEPDLSEAECGPRSRAMPSASRSSLVDHVGATVGQLDRRARTHRRPFTSDDECRHHDVGRVGVDHEPQRRALRGRPGPRASTAGTDRGLAPGHSRARRRRRSYRWPTRRPESSSRSSNLPTRPSLVHLPVALVDRLGELPPATVRGERRDAELVTIDGSASGATSGCRRHRSGRQRRVRPHARGHHDMTERMQLEEQLATRPNDSRRSPPWPAASRTTSTTC